MNKLCTRNDRRHNKEVHRRFCNGGREMNHAWLNTGII